MPDKSFSPWPSYSQEEANAVTSVLLSNKVNYWTGEECRKFEREFASFVGCKYSVALANGTVALDVALKAMKIGFGDEVIVPSRTFLASASSVVNAGATPVFADVDAVSQNVTVETISAVFTKKTRAIMCVHLAGWPCDMDPIMSFAKEHKLWVIEDCAQAHGARYKGRSVGGIGHVGCWSFCQDKIMTTGGEGGMVTTNNKDLWSKMWSFKDHGKSWEAVYERKHPPGFRWVHESFGTNFRMTEMQAAIGRIQLRRMHEWHSARKSNLTRIWAAASNCHGLKAPRLKCVGCESKCENLKGCVHAAYKCYVFVEGTESDRNAIMALINSRGVPCFSGSCSEVYLEKAFDNGGWRPKHRLPNARMLGELSLMFLCHPTLTEDEVFKTCQAIEKSSSEYWASKI
ncbi:DegT/DnrJ/EryC1/StrS aminotransferase family protein [Alphaproteobacteria bacterium]|nr:DegT/DnrJ/EryC1/StrS aminotransferase family protein [Alphaproteobacteria bacterium]